MRHESLVVPEFIALLRQFSVAVVLAESTKHPLIADVTADFVYGRLQRSSEKEKTGYATNALDLWAKRAQAWRRPTISSPSRGRRRTRARGMYFST